MTDLQRAAELWTAIVDLIDEHSDAQIEAAIATHFAAVRADEHKRTVAHLAESIRLDGLDLP